MFLQHTSCDALRPRQWSFYRNQMQDELLPGLLCNLEKYGIRLKCFLRLDKYEKEKFGFQDFISCVIILMRAFQSHVIFFIYMMIQ